MWSLTFACVTTPLDLSDLFRRIEGAFFDVKMDELEHVYENTVKRMQLCIEVEGAYLERII